MVSVLCKECTREISTEAVYCPHCGSNLKNNNGNTEKTRSDDPFAEFDDLQSSHTQNAKNLADSKAVTGLVLAIVAIFLPIPVLDIACSVIAIVLGSQASKMQELTKKGTATAAFVVGIIGLIMNVIFWMQMI